MSRTIRRLTDHSRKFAMNVKSFEELQNEYAAALSKMFATPHAYRFRTEPGNDGSHHVEIIGGEYHLVATERGLELERRKTTNPEEILFWMVAHIAFWQGVDFEFKNRIETLDCRRAIFSKQVELLARVNPVWAQRQSEEIERILAENPFDDR